MTKMTDFKPGQKWVSNAEPELGMGQILAAEGRRVSIRFDLTGETRTYAVGQAPLTRARFSPGDTLKGSDIQLLVDSVTERNGLYIYHGRYLGTDTAIIETDLDPDVRFSKPEQRLLTRQLDDNAWFNLRYHTLTSRTALAGSPVRGLIGPRVSLIPHQLYIASEVGNRYAPRVLLADEVGLGKTIEAGLIIHQQLATGLAQRVLIIVPPGLIFQWFVEMIRRFNLQFTLLDESRLADIEADNLSDDEDSITNPFEAQQLMLCSLDLFAEPKRLQQALEAEWDLILVDEAHHLHWQEGSPSPEYALVESLAAIANGLLLLTATPEQLGRAGHFSRLRLLDPSRYYSYDAFLAEEADYQQITQLVRSFFSDSDKEKDKARRKIVKLTGQAAGASDEDLLAALLDRHGTGRVLFRNVRESVKGFPQRHLARYPVKDDDEAATGPDARTRWLTELVSKSTDKFLIIAGKLEEAIRLERHLRESTGIRTAAFHEGMDLVSRDRAANYFADTEQGAQVLVCSEVGSEGRNFQFAHQVIMWDLPYSPDLLEQRIGRLDRIGQQHDVAIHVPYAPGSPQQGLLRLYDEAFNIFSAPNPAAQQIFDALPQLDPIDDKLIKSAKESSQQTLAELKQGRDLLLELNSHRPAVSSRLAKQLADPAPPKALEAYMELSFDLFGLESEPLAPGVQVVRPTEAMVRQAAVSAETLDHFHYPDLPEAGLGITYDRATALAREDLQYLTWEHPLVEQAMDAALADVTGNCTAIAVKLKGVKPGNLLLETLHLVECPSPPGLNAGKFLPPQVLRSLITPTKLDLADKVPFKDYSQHLSIAKEALGQAIASQEETIRAMLTAAADSAGQRMPPLQQAALKAMNHALTQETTRLEQLAKVNPNIRQEELDHLHQARASLAAAIEASSCRLDAVRLIVTA